MINSNFFLGVPQNFLDICKVYPPKIIEIVSDQNYPVYKKLLLTSQEDIEDELVEKGERFTEVPTPFERLFSLIGEDERFKDIIVKAFTFFIHEPVTLLTDAQIVVIGELEEVLSQAQSLTDLHFITKDNFFMFQNLLRESIGENPIEPYNPDENPKVKYFKAKARMRDRVKANSKDGLNLGTILAVISCMNLGLNPLNVGEITQAALGALMRYYQEKTKYEIDIQSLLAGADRKKVKPINWIRNLTD